MMSLEEEEEEDYKLSKKAEISISILLIGQCDVRTYVRSGREMYEWVISSLKYLFLLYGPVFRGPAYPSAGVATGCALLPVRRAVGRSTKLKCCDSVLDAVSSDATICATRRSSDGTRVSRCSLSTEHATDGLWVCKSLSSRHILFDVSCRRLRLMHNIFCSLLATNRTWHRSDSAKLFDSTIHSKACCWFFRTEQQQQQHSRQQQQWQSRCSNSNSGVSSQNSISSNNNSSSSYNV